MRMAGFAGCAYQEVSSALNGASEWDKNLFGRPIAGYEDSVDTFPNPTTYPIAITTAVPTPANRVLRGDAITILLTDEPSDSGTLSIDAHNPPAAQFSLNANHCIKPGTILVVCGSATCPSSGNITLAAIFQMTGPTNSNCTAGNMVHNTGGTETPGNCSKYLGPQTTAGDCTTNEACQFASGKFLYLKSVLYFIRNNQFNEPSLYRQTLQHTGGSAVTSPEEVVEGVENMQITYGVDTVFTDADGNGIDDVKEPTQYVTADQVTVVVPTSANITSDEDKWKQVRTIRISLLMVSRQDENVTSAEQTYTFGGNPPPTPQPTVVPTDRRLRKAFTTVIAVRNRL